MSFIFTQRVGKYAYVYEGESYRNADGKPRNRRKRIGRVDPDSNEAIYEPSYLDQLRQAGKPLPKNAQTDPKAGKRDNAADMVAAVDSSRFFGSAYALESLAEQTGLLPLLKEIFPEEWRKLFGLASFLTEDGEALMNYQHWAGNRIMLSGESMSSQRISEPLHMITETQRNDFYEKWMALLPQKEYTALDITSISSYSENIEGVERGYNRDGEKLPQINVCLLSGEESKLPYYQTTYRGSLTDVTTLKSTLDEIAALVPGRLLRVVMDKGFYSDENIRALMDPRGFGFLMAVPFIGDFAKEQVDAVRDSILTSDNGVTEPGHVLYGLHKVRSWPGCKDKVHVFIYFDQEKAAHARSRLTRLIKDLEKKVRENPDKWRHKRDVQKYLRIRNSKKTASGITVSIRHDVEEEELRYEGWLVIIGNQIMSTQQALDIYRAKNVVEEGFHHLKNIFGLDRLTVHSDESAQNKLFIGFLAQILTNVLYVRMKQSGLLDTYTLRELLHMLAGLRRGSVRGKEIIVPATKEQRTGFKKLGVKLP